MKGGTVMLSPSLRDRLDFEQQIIAEHFPDFFSFLFFTNPYVEGTYTTTSGDNSYTLKLIITPWYPDEMPELYVTYPKILRKYDYIGSINEEDVSHEFHTFGTSPEGHVQICHTKPEYWDPSQTCAGVLSKGIMWCEAYDCYLATGRTIATILDEFRRRISW